ncbi:hypothetical protein [Agarivorans sp. 1_MG-2023]|uniref:hypothetical protein n=1 Tax=Agarivorans sp. 1_MG-2023 TaxID=3062634 RepID=UPI0026E1B3D0|nr:hypothetical protein [Agarivorans sp. 1_MG-2023]MDO6764802.1 hypothetical protein [Agarivorans sp. 1_MG-2023]
MKIIIVSGMAIGRSGVGQFLEAFQGDERFQLICRKDRKSLRNLVAKKRYLNIVLEIMARLFNDLCFYFKLRTIKKNVVIIVHPQTLGYSNFRFITENNVSYLYLLDSWYFCIRSYNYVERNKECLKCIECPTSNRLNMIARTECRSFPTLLSRTKYLAYSRYVKEAIEAEDLRLLYQNDSQKLLASRFFSANKGSVVGMPAVKNVGAAPYVSLELEDFDFVYHGTKEAAKGIYYFLSVAALMPEKSFFVPVERSSIFEGDNTNYKKFDSLSNVTFCDCTWESGLADVVKRAGLVINPTLWSAPVEGALIKSMLINDNVATIASGYSFSTEIPKNAIVELPNCEKAAAQKLRSLAGNWKLDKEAKDKWISKFMSKNNIDSIFESVWSDLHVR